MASLLYTEQLDDGEKHTWNNPKFDNNVLDVLGCNLVDFDETKIVKIVKTENR